MYRWTKTVLMLLVVLAFGACSNNKADIGDGTAISKLGENLSDYEGTWEGYAEAYTFSDKSDKVMLMLDTNGQGTLKVGEATFEKTEPDPDAYPPGMEMEREKAVGKLSTGLTPGFSYPITGAVVEARRIRVSTNTNETFRDWCELQTSYYSENTVPPTYACLPGGGGYAMSTSDDSTMTCMAGSGSDAVPISCGRANCIFVCVCTESGCSIDATKDVQLDAALQDEGEELQGTLVIGGERIVVRMTRQ